MPPDLSLRGGRRPTWRPERAARGSALGVQSRRTRPHRGKAIGENATAFLAMTRQAGAAVHQSSPAVSCPSARRSLTAATDAIGPCVLSTPCTNCKCLPEIAPQGHFLALRAQGATSAYGLLAMTNRGPSAILTIACTGCKCVAGSGMPLPYNFPRDLLLSLYTAAAFFSTAAAVFFRRDLRFRPFCDNIRGRY